MSTESHILRIVREDILRMLAEERKKVSLDSIKSEVKVSSFFISKALKELEREGLIRVEENFIRLTEMGEEKSKDILRKHLTLENYFKRTLNEGKAHKKAHILEHYISEEVIRNIEKLYTLKGGGNPLTKFRLHEEGLIADIVIPSYELFERIVSMGIYPGEKIKIINDISDGFIVKIKNKKFAIDKQIAKYIKVLEYGEP